MIAIKINNACGVADSKFFGEAYLPESWLDSDEFSLTEVFFCQINLEDVAKFDEQKLLPDKGYLYFFMDFDCKTVKGIVRYAESPDAYTFFNEDAEVDYDVETEFGMDFYPADNAAVGLLAKHKKLYENEVCLLKFTPDAFADMDFLSGTDGAIMFVIDKEDLKNKKFDKAFLINVK